MMKSFFKKLAFVMALAMVVSMVAPAGSAFAAEAGVSLQGTKTIVETYELDKVGATVDFSFQGAPSDWKTTFAWTSSNEAVATVDKAGVVTAVAAGTATITITAGADASYVHTVKVTVKEEIKDAFVITQKSTNKVELTFADKAPKKEDLEKGLSFNLVIAGVPVTLPVNTVSVKDNVATVTVFNTFVDGEEYSFVYGDDTVSFVASVGEIARVEYSYFTVQEETTKQMWGVAYVNEEDVDFETTLVPTLYDANNVDITAMYDLDDDLEIKYELLVDNDDIELGEDDGTVSFETVAAAAIKMTVVWEDEEDEEHTKDYTGVVVAEKLPEIAVEYVNSGFVKARDFVEDAMGTFKTNPWTAFWNGTISLRNSYTLPEDGDQYVFAALFNDNRGGKVVSGNTNYQYGTFSYVSSNDDVVYVDAEGELTFYEAGSAYILIYFTPASDDDDAKPVFVGSKKITVSPAKYATSFKVANTSMELASNQIYINSWDVDASHANYNAANFTFQVLDNTGSVYYGDLSSYFEVKPLKEEYPDVASVSYNQYTGTYSVAFDGDSFTLDAKDDSEKFKYELSVDTEAYATQKIKTKPVTLTVKVENNATEAAELAKFLGVDSLNGTTATKAAKEFEYTGLKGGWPIDVVVKQSENFKGTDENTSMEVKVSWSNNLMYVDGNDHAITKVPKTNFVLKTKDITTGEAGKVYYTISAPKNAANWATVLDDGGIVFLWNTTEEDTTYYNKDTEFEGYATPGTYSVTYYTASKDGATLKSKGTWSYTISNSQTASTFEGFIAGVSNYTDINIPEEEDKTKLTAGELADLSEIVQSHFKFTVNGATLDSENDWNLAGASIDWAHSDFSITAGKKLRIKKLVIVAPVDDKGGEKAFFTTTVTVGKNIFAAEEE